MFSDDETDLSFKPAILRDFIDVMPSAVMSEVLEVRDNVFKYCYYHRPELIAWVTKFVTFSAENAAKIGLYGDSLTSLHVWENYNLPRGERRKNNEDVLERILVPRGDQLLSLCTELESAQAANIVANNCTRLRELELRMQNRNQAYLDVILPKVGKTLCKLKDSFELSRDELRVIRNHCPSLNSLSISCAEGERDSLANLIASYGGNLKHAHLPLGFGAENVRTVLSNCPQVELSVYIQEVHCPFICAVSKHVVEIDLYQDDIVLSPRDLQFIFSKCSVLRKLEITDANCAYVQPIWRNQNFEYPFISHLSMRYLEIDYVLTPFNLMYIAKSFKSLEKIHLTMGTECFKDGLEELVASNKGLQKACLLLPVAYHGTSEDPTDEIFELGKKEVRMIHNAVEITAKCENLRGLLLLSYNTEHSLGCFACDWPIEKDEERLHDLLLHTGLRRRNVFVDLMSNQFLPA